MPPSEFEFTQQIKQRLLGLNEIYQAVPFPGFSDLPARRGCDDRVKMIEHLVPSEGRVLDLGSNLGYYCFRLAQIKNARCHGVECVPETYEICRELVNYYQVPGVTFHRARITPGLVLESPPVDLILMMAVLHHILRDHDQDFVEGILKAARERCRHLIVELPAPEEDGWKADKAIAFPDPVLPWLMDLGLYPAEALHVKSHLGTQRQFLHLRPVIIKKGDERYNAELVASSAATGVPGVPAFFTHFQPDKRIYSEYIPGPVLDTYKIEHEKPADIWCSLARTIAGLHARGVVHGDVRAWNVILNTERPYLVDFGLALTKEHGPTDYQWGVYAGLPDTQDWDWLGLAAMKWYADKGRTQPKHPYDWLPDVVEQNKLEHIKEAKSWATK